MTSRAPVLPDPPPAAQDASRALTALIARDIEAAGGWISFARYMELALYTPGLGYYAGGSVKFGTEGDFVTAPELTPLFGQALARQVAQVLSVSEPAVLEAGAGSGHLAADLLLALEAVGEVPDHYAILEVSSELRARQRQTIAMRAPHLLSRVSWLDRLPESFSGCVIGNEVLDAMPVHCLHWDTAGMLEQGVVSRGPAGFAWDERPASSAIATWASTLGVSPPYEGELSLAASAWVREWGYRLSRGAVLLIDYGLPRHELYHPQRHGGTLRCHYRHRAHQDPFWWPGLSDITSHVDFTAVAEAGFEAGLDVLGYTNQATFLVNCGIADLLSRRRDQGNSPDTARATGAVNLLLSPNEMGELFKVIALGRGLDRSLDGFVRGDRTHTL